MTDKELDKWWGHLTVAKKEAVSELPYPQCSTWWCSLSRESKETLYNINGGRNAHQHHEWKKGNTSFT